MKAALIEIRHSPFGSKLVFVRGRFVGSVRRQGALGFVAMVPGTHSFTSPFPTLDDAVAFLATSIEVQS